MDGCPVHFKSKTSVLINDDGAGHEGSGTVSGTLQCNDTSFQPFRRGKEGHEIPQQVPKHHHPTSRHLSDNTYETLSVSLPPAARRRSQTVYNNWKKQKVINRTTSYCLYSGERPQCILGQPKIHGDDIPLRAIVSSSTQAPTVWPNTSLPCWPHCWAIPNTTLTILQTSQTELQT